MSDVRALLKAKRQETRISHPLASYSASGQLKCAVCSTPVKHPSAWEGHLGSKAHRTNVIRLKEEERRREEEEEAQRTASLKRKAEDDIPHAQEPDVLAKRSKSASAQPTPFPAGFFSDPNQAPAILSDDEDDEDQPPVNAPQSQPSQAQSVLDQEWLQFQQAVINAPDDRETYQRATVFADPEINKDATQGFPAGQEDQPEPEPEPDLEQQRWKREEDDRELIMDRLLDEERAQEEADMRVNVMKSRLEAMRKKRELAKTKTKSVAGAAA